MGPEPKGEIVLTSTYKLLRDLGQFVNAIEATQHDLLGSVRLFMIDTIRTHAECHVSRAIAGSRKQNPYLTFELCRMAPGRIETARVKREADVAVGWFSSITPSLQCEPLLAESHRVFFWDGHTLFERGPSASEPRELEDTDLVTGSYDKPKTIHFAHPHDASAASHYMEGIAHFVLAGTHIGYQPEHLADPGLTKAFCVRSFPTHASFSFR